MPERGTRPPAITNGSHLSGHTYTFCARGKSRAPCSGLSAHGWRTPTDFHVDARFFRLFSCVLRMRTGKNAYHTEDSKRQHPPAAATGVSAYTHTCRLQAGVAERKRDKPRSFEYTRVPTARGGGELKCVSMLAFRTSAFSVIAPIAISAKRMHHGIRGRQYPHTAPNGISSR